MAKKSESASSTHTSTPSDADTSPESSTSSLDLSQQQESPLSGLSSSTAPRFLNSPLQESDFLNSSYLPSSSSTLPIEPLRIHMLPTHPDLSDAPSEVSESGGIPTFWSPATPYPTYERSHSTPSEATRDEESHRQSSSTSTVHEYRVEITIVETINITLSNQQTGSLPTPQPHTNQTSCMGAVEEGCSDCCVIL